MKHNESVRETHEEDNEQSKMLERKLKFFKKKTIPKAQNTRFFATKPSRVQVARQLRRNF